MKGNRVHIYFTACTTGEAVNEINIMLKQAGYPEITADNCVSNCRAEHEDDWFEDYNFIFETTLTGTSDEIEQKLSGAGLEFELIDN